MGIGRKDYLEEFHLKHASCAYLLPHSLFPGSHDIRRFAVLCLQYDALIDLSLEAVLMTNPGLRPPKACAEISLRHGSPRALDPLGLEPQRVVICHVGAGN